MILVSLQTLQIVSKA